MKLIDRYVAEVGRRLPLVRGRADIEKELRSTLEDMLEDRARKAGRPADEAMEVQLLKEYGAPHRVAATYNPHPYLIGPVMFPFFIRVLKIALSIQAIVLLVLLGVQVATQSPMLVADLFKAIGHGLAGIYSATISAFGTITLIFAVLERYAPQAAEARMEEEMEWDPASLMKEPEPGEVKPWEPIVSIIFLFIVLSIFNFNPQLIGIYSLKGETWTVIPVLTDAFFRLLPLMNVAWIAEIILNGMLLRTSRWLTSIRLFYIVIKAFQILILSLLLSGPSILAITPESLRASGIFDAQTAQTLGTLARQGIRVLLGLGIFGTVVDIIKTSYNMVTQRPAVRA